MADLTQHQQPGAQGLATDLATTGASVNVSNTAPPVAGQVPVATSPTQVDWQYPRDYYCPEDYGAVGDGVQLWFGAITSGSSVYTCAMANFTSADISKVIEIEKAGVSSAPLKAYIGSINSSTSVNLVTTRGGSTPATASTTVTGIWSSTGLTVNGAAGYDHEPTAYYGTDDTAAFQAALDAIITGLNTHSQNYARLKLKNRIYMLDGALQDTANSNAQLYLKDLGYGFLNKLTIEISGDIEPNITFNNSNGQPKTPAYGAVLKCTLNAGTNGAVFRTYGTLSGGFAFHRAYIVIRNLTLRMPNNPVLSGFDLRQSVSADVSKVVFDTGIYKVHAISQPSTAASYALKMPQINNGSYCHVDVYVIGFYNAVEIGEHATGRVSMWACYKGLWLNEIRIAALLSMVNSVSCTYAVNVSQTGATYSQISIFEIQQMRVERHDVSNPQAWMMSIAEFSDAGNYGHGKITYACVNNRAFTKSGGATVTCTELY